MERQRCDCFTTLSCVYRLLDKQSESALFKQFLADAANFASEFMRYAEHTPLSLYTSPLYFTHEKSLVRYTFAHYIPVWVKRTCKLKYDQVIQLPTFHDQPAPTRVIIFSHKGHSLGPKASCTFDLCRSALGSHSNCNNATLWLRRDLMLASTSDTETVRLWDLSTEFCYETLPDHADTSNVLAFSDVAQLLRSALTTSTIRLWDASANSFCFALNGLADRDTRLSFSQDGLQLTSTSTGSTVQF